MRTALLAAGLAALAALLVFGVFGAMFGAMLGAGEVRGVPAVLGLVAVLVLTRFPISGEWAGADADRSEGTLGAGARALGPAAGWVLLGAAGAVALRAGLGGLGTDGWLPAEDHRPAERAFEAAWWLAVAGLAWRGGAGPWAGPLVAACVATTRIGGFGQALVPILFEPTLRDAVLVAANILAGFAAGVIVLLAAGWALAILVRLPARWVPPGRVLAALAAAAGIGHMLRL